MPSTYTIESIGQKILWENEQNKGDYPAVFVGHTQEVLVFHDDSSNYDPPKVGDELYGDVQKDKRGRWRFKRASRKGTGSGTGGDKPRDDATGKSIERQKAADIAMNGAVSLGGGEVGMPQILANFEAAFEVVIAKIQGAAPKQQMEIPAETDGLGERQAVPADDIPFS